MTAVPDSLSVALSPHWLTEALRQRFPGVEVVKVTPGPVVDRISTNARFTIDCAGPLPEGLSSRLCVKGYFNGIGRAARFVGEPEAYFYRDLAAVSGVRTLAPVYVDVDPNTRHGVVITADVAAEGAEFLDGRSPYTVDQTAQSLDELARLHAATWSDPRWSAAHWLAPRMGKVFESWGMDGTTAIIAGNLHGPNGAGVPGEVRDERQLIDAYREMAVSIRGIAGLVRDSRRPTRREPLRGCGRRPALTRLATRATWFVVHRRRIPHRLYAHRRRSAQCRTRFAAALSGQPAVVRG